MFFEHPITNPFGHEERFQIVIKDPELRVVTSYSEWMYLRQHSRPCVGELGMEPVEMDMLDIDNNGHIQVALLPHETLYIPFTFLTFIPHIPNTQVMKRKSPYYLSEEKEVEEEVDEEVARTTVVHVVSGSHGHIVAVVKVTIAPIPFVLDRTMRFFEPENSIMKRRIHLISRDHNNNREVVFPGEFITASKYVHCVEGTSSAEFASDDNQSRVVVEWGASEEQHPGMGMGSLDLLIRYRCGPFPGLGMFYLLIYSDPYQSQLFEVGQSFM